MGVFFVTKKDGTLRLILDTRIVNIDFNDPISTRLPTADALSGIEVDPAGNFIGHGDIECAFYGFSIPEELSDHFRLDPIPAHLLGLREIDGEAIGPNELVLPCLGVLGMGWNWALHLCQLALRENIRQGGVPDSFIIEDGRPSRTLVLGSEPLIAGYVDNYGAIGPDADAVNDVLRRITKALEKAGLRCHELTLANGEQEFLGLEFFDKGRRLRIRGKRVWRLRFGIDAALARG